MVNVINAQYARNIGLTDIKPVSVQVVGVQGAQVRVAGALESVNFQIADAVYAAPFVVVEEKTVYDVILGNCFIKGHGG